MICILLLTSLASKPCVLFLEVGCAHMSIIEIKDEDAGIDKYIHGWVKMHHANDAIMKIITNWGVG